MEQQRMNGDGSRRAGQRVGSSLTDRDDGDGNGRTLDLGEQFSAKNFQAGTADHSVGLIVS